MPQEKIDAVLSLNVKGKEELNIKVEYLGTTLDTVKAVQKAVAEALLELNG